MTRQHASDEIAASGFVVLDEMEIRGRYEQGTDWGAKRRILARDASGRTMLFLNQGHSAAVGARGFGREYHPARVVLFADKWPGLSGRFSRNLAEGRLDVAALVRDHAAEIEKVFDCPGLAAALDGRRTIVVGGVTPKQV